MRGVVLGGGFWQERCGFGRGCSFWGEGVVLVCGFEDGVVLFYTSISLPSLAPGGMM